MLMSDFVHITEFNFTINIFAKSKEIMPKKYNH